MFTVNYKAVHLFKPGMSYSECAETFRAAGHGSIPFGEYCLMLGIWTHAEKSGIPWPLIVAGLHHYCDPVMFEPDTTQYEEL